MIALVGRHLLESTLFCVLLGTVACCLRRQAAAARHTVWLIGISKFAVPTVVLTATGAHLALVLPASGWVSVFVAKLSTVLVGLFGTWPSRIAGEVTAAWMVFLAIWVLGSLVVFATWLIKLRGSYRGLRAPAREECEALERAKRLSGFGRSARLRSSDRARGPALLGIWHSTITLPEGLSERLSASELDAVLAHELAHARRRDNLTAAFVHCLVCIFWFHPLVWLVERRLAAERERACDEMVINSVTTPRIYLAALAKVCRFHLLEPVAGVSGVTGSDLKARFDQIISCRLHQPIPFAFRVLVGALAAYMSILPVADGYCEQCVSNGQGMTTKENTTRFLEKHVNRYSSEEP